MVNPVYKRPLFRPDVSILLRQRESSLCESCLSMLGNTKGAWGCDCLFFNLLHNAVVHYMNSESANTLPNHYRQDNSATPVQISWRRAGPHCPLCSPDSTQSESEHLSHNATDKCKNCKTAQSFSWFRVDTAQANISWLMIIRSVMNRWLISLTLVLSVKVVNLLNIKWFRYHVLYTGAIRENKISKVRRVDRAVFIVPIRICKKI